MKNSMLPGNTIYVKIYVNRLHIRNVEGAEEIDLSAEEPFSTERLLVGTFTAARALLTRGIKIVTGRRTFSLNILMHPMEKIEGGLSQVEERVLKDLALSVGADNTEVWTGHELKDDEVLREMDR